MILIFLTIVLSSYLTLAFKMLQRWKISSFQAIVFNYLTCVVTGSLVNGAYPADTIRNGDVWLPWSILMGTMFIALFNLIAFVTRRLGVALASVSNKLSLVIPFLFSIVVHQDKAHWFHYAGIGLALLAVVLTCWPDDSSNSSTEKVSGWMLWLIPAGLFIGSGMLDTLIMHTERRFLDDGNKDDFLILAFHTAGTIGLLLLAILVLSKKEKPDIRALLAGIGIGIPNYFSIQTLMMALDRFTGQSTMVVPVVNIGIVLFSTVVAFYLFKEHLSKLNRIGILLAVVSILLLSLR
jgi:drug/metabolite transporter (DMT)-like permease